MRSRIGLLFAALAMLLVSACTPAAPSPHTTSVLRLQVTAEDPAFGDGAVEVIGPFGEVHRCEVDEADCSLVVARGSSIQLEAAATSTVLTPELPGGGGFAWWDAYSTRTAVNGWSGPCAGAGARCSLTLDSAVTTVSVDFELLEIGATVAVLSSGERTCTPPDPDGNWFGEYCALSSFDVTLTNLGDHPLAELSVEVGLFNHEWDSAAPPLTVSGVGITPVMPSAFPGSAHAEGVDLAVGESVTFVVRNAYQDCHNGRLSILGPSNGSTSFRFSTTTDDCDT